MEQKAIQQEYRYKFEIQSSTSGQWEALKEKHTWPRMARGDGLCLHKHKNTQNKYAHIYALTLTLSLFFSLNTTDNTIL